VWRHRVFDVFLYCVCTGHYLATAPFPSNRNICCRGNVFSGPLPSNVYTRYIAPSLRLFVPNCMHTYRLFYLSEFSTRDVFLWGGISCGGLIRTYYCADISWPVSFTVSAWERVYATRCRENIRRLAAGKLLARGNNTQYLLTTAILLAERLTSYWGNIVSLRMHINLRLANLASDRYASEIPLPKSTVPAILRIILLVFVRSA
jgi:hypothetical protein